MGGGKAGVELTPAAILDKVLDEVLVTADDWGQGNTVQRGGKNCAWTAMSLAAELIEGDYNELDRTAKIRHWDVMGVVQGAMKDVVGVQSSMFIPRWNDSPDTTFEDVRLAFKQARESVDG